MMKKIISSLLVLAVLLVAVMAGGAMAGQPVGTPFKDLKIDFWAFQAISGGVQKGYIDGFEDRTFRPFEKVTRAQFAKMLVVAAGYSICDCPDDIFTDVKNGNWATPFIKTAIKEGLIYPGEYDFKFEGDKAITRLEMAKMAVRSLVGKKEGPMYQAVKLGVLKGYPSDKGLDLKPEGLTNRAESVVVIERVLTIKSGGTLDVDSKMVEQAEVLEFGSNAETIMGVPIVKLPMTIDMGAYDAVIEQILVYDETNQNTQYAPMFEHAINMSAPADSGKYYRLAFKIKGVNKIDKPYVVGLDALWHIEARSVVQKVDAEKYKYLPFRLTLEAKGNLGSIQEGYFILGARKETVKNLGGIILQAQTAKGIEYINLATQR
jgi:hypothetical protein